MRSALWVVFASLATSVAGAAGFAENFSTHPAATGWKFFGDTNLFHWNPTNENIEVTWDSSRTNSYFYRPLNTILASDDDFSLSFDLRLLDYAIGTTPNKASTFEIAVGFLNLDSATKTNFSRASGVNAFYGPDNLVEFDFFPAFSTYQPTIAPTIFPIINDTPLYNHDNLLDLTPGSQFHVDMDYSSATRTFTTVTLLNGSQYGQTQAIQVPAGFDFRVGVVSINSYSDQNQNPRYAGSILAHGVIDNFAVTLPPPPVQNCSGGFSNIVWQMQFTSRSNWLYALERTEDFQTWTTVSSTMPGNASSLLLQDTAPLTSKSFYRVRAERP